ncbi:MAG: hypothetical protein Q4C00_07665, partial [Bacillota bacterium]|nr:hypothetical protein [Bacillota bacterium]
MIKNCSVIVSNNYFSEKNILNLYSDLQGIINDFSIPHIILGTDGETELKLLDLFIEDKREYNDIEITAVVTSENNLVEWSEKQRIRFFELIVNCDRELLLSPPLEALSIFYKHLIMVDIADLVLLIGDDPTLELIIKKNGKKLLRFDVLKGTF